MGAMAPAQAPWSARAASNCIITVLLCSAQVCKYAAALESTTALSSTSQDGLLRDAVAPSTQAASAHRQLLQETSIDPVALKPGRDNPIDGFKKYRDGLIVTSDDYWAASLWLGVGFLVIALICVALYMLLLVTRCVFMFTDEGFCPNNYDSSMTPKWEGPLRFISAVIMVVQFITLLVFAVYAMLAIQEGKQIADRIPSAYDSQVTAVTAIASNASSLQAVVSGNAPVAGSFINGIFLPNTPRLLEPSQAMINDMERVATVVKGSQGDIWNTYEAAFIVWIFVFVLVALSLAMSFAGVFMHSRSLVLVSMFVLPIVTILVWIAAAVFFGLWITTKDLCGATEAYVLLAPPDRMTAQLQRDLVPCPAMGASQTLNDEARRTYVLLTRNANAVITNQYNKPVMNSFSADPLLCEGYVYNNATGVYDDVTCPFPSTLHRFTPEEWAANNEGLKCTGNTDLDCAAAGTPLTSGVFNQARHMMVFAAQAGAIVRETQPITTCESSVEVLVNNYDSSCVKDDIRQMLLAAWVNLTILGCMSVILVPLLMFLHYVMIPEETKLMTTDNTMFQHGADGRGKLAMGYRPTDYRPGDASLEFEAYNISAKNHHMMPDSPLSDYYQTAARPVSPASALSDTAASSPR